MSQSAIFFPVFVQALLTLCVLILLGPARARSMREAQQRLTDEDVRVGRNTWSEEATKVSNNFKNQFELPVLFYAVIAFAIALKQADPVMTGLAWIFAVSRLAHAAIHVGPNVVMWRGVAYIIGAATLLVLWLLLGWRVYVGTVGAGG